MLTKSDELKDQIDLRKADLLKRFAELKADTRKDAIDARDKVKAKLDELELYLKAGWDKLSAEAHTKLAEWLRKD
jgi:hypothetical protein